MGDWLPPIELGVGAVVTRVATGDSHSCALLRGGSLKCWGGHGFGAKGAENWMVTGMAGSMGDNMPIINVGLDR